MVYNPIQGSLISMETFNTQHEKWLDDPVNEGLPPSFNFTADMIWSALSDEMVAGLKFCNGMDAMGDYVPVICAVNQPGKVLMSYNEFEPIPNEEAEAFQSIWVSEKGEEVLRSFYLGRVSLFEYLRESRGSQLTASFMLNPDNQSTGAIIVEGRSEVLNFSLPCPPACD